MAVVTSPPSPAHPGIGATVGGMDNILGHPGGMTSSWSHIAGPGWAAAGHEENPDLMFPQSVWLYDRMRRTDTQVAAILRAVALPLRATRWTLNTDGVDPAVAEFVADELNLAGDGHRTGGVSWSEHLREVLLALAWGFAPFERVYEIGPARTAGAPATVAHLGALASRPPRTLIEVRVTPDGDLAGVVQAARGLDTAYAGWGGSTQSSGDVFIPRDRLAYYVLDREGADWTGTSLLRAAYKNWFLKEEALRHAGQAVERNSMGLPVVEYDDDSDRVLALDIATAARAGATAGVAIPRGRMSFTMSGVAGSTVDALPLIAYHDQAMTRSALAMFLDLGHDNGARALGDTFVDFFTASLRSLAEWIGNTASSEVIRPLVEVNFGPDATAPTLVCEEITAKQSATADAVRTLVDSGVVTPDAGLQDQMRRAYGLPERDRDAPLPEPAPVVGMPVDQAIQQAQTLVERLAVLRSREQ